MIHMKCQILLSLKNNNKKKKKIDKTFVCCCFDKHFKGYHYKFLNLIRLENWFLGFG